MTLEDQLEECKVALGLPLSSQTHDRVIKQKLNTVKAYMKGAGVTDELLQSETAIGTIVMGVTDIWNLDSGAVKFSGAFNLLTNQLAVDSLPDVITA